MGLMLRVMHEHERAYAKQAGILNFCDSLYSNAKAAAKKSSKNANYAQVKEYNYQHDLRSAI